MQGKLTFRLPWHLIKFSSLDLIHMVVLEDYSRNITVKLLSKYLSQLEIKAYFHFHYKSMET